MHSLVVGVELTICLYLLQNTLSNFRLSSLVVSSITKNHQLIWLLLLAIVERCLLSLNERMPKTAMWRGQHLAMFHFADIWLNNRSGLHAIHANLFVFQIVFVILYTKF